MSRKVKPFEPLEISADVYNHAVDLFRGSIGKNVTSSGLPPNRKDTRILARNDTGDDLPKFSVVQIGSPLIAPPTLDDDDAGDGTDGDSDSDFFENYIVSVSFPTDATLYKWGVTQEPIPAGEIGELLISGVTAVRIDMDSRSDLRANGYATPTNTTRYLNFIDCGICRVLCTTGGDGDGHQWALVNLG